MVTPSHPHFRTLSPEGTAICLLQRLAWRGFDPRAISEQTGLPEFEGSPCDRGAPRALRQRNCRWDSSRALGRAGEALGHSSILMRATTDRPVRVRVKDECFAGSHACSVLPEGTRRGSEWSHDDGVRSERGDSVTFLRNHIERSLSALDCMLWPPSSSCASVFGSPNFARSHGLSGTNSAGRRKNIAQWNVELAERLHPFPAPSCGPSSSSWRSSLVLRGSACALSGTVKGELGCLITITQPPSTQRADERRTLERIGSNGCPSLQSRRRPPRAQEQASGEMWRTGIMVEVTLR